MWQRQQLPLYMARFVVSHLCSLFLHAAIWGPLLSTYWLRASRVEQSSSRSPSDEHFTASVQETTENVPVLG